MLNCTNPHDGAKGTFQKKLNVQQHIAELELDVSTPAHRYGDIFAMPDSDTSLACSSRCKGERGWVPSERALVSFIATGAYYPCLRDLGCLSIFLPKFPLVCSHLDPLGVLLVSSSLHHQFSAHSRENGSGCC